MKSAKPSGSQPEAGRAREARPGTPDALRPGPFRSSDLALQPDVPDRERKLVAQEDRREKEAEGPAGPRGGRGV